MENTTIYTIEMQFCGFEDIYSNGGGTYGIYTDQTTAQEQLELKKQELLENGDYEIKEDTAFGFIAYQIYGEGEEEYDIREWEINKTEDTYRRK